MAKKKRKVPSLNSTSSADIAFIMLLFFLLTSSMDTDRGLPRRLPPPPQKDQKMNDVKVKKRNILVVLISSTNAVRAGEEYISDMSQLRNIVKEFVENATNNEHMPEKTEVDVPFFGNMMVTKNHVVSLLNDRGTSYQSYITVQSEIVAAYAELRNEASQKKFGKNFMELNEEQQEAVKKIYPQNISEAEPKNYSKK
ncbi:MAG: biopolymer transporter ExbD [Tannerellaceae bacterium]|jgi:biopolymer transport protein ExbD|nr:biopolymer transporter ExbD [Tannerellaceae bacterium]